MPWNVFFGLWFIALTVGVVVYVTMERNDRLELIRECIVEVGPQLGAMDYCKAKIILEGRW